MVAEQTEQVIAEWLGLGGEQIAALCSANILEPLAPITRKQAEDFMAGTDQTSASNWNELGFKMAEV